MNATDTATPARRPAPPTGAYGTLSEPATLTIQRHLPGPLSRVWAHLVDEDLRRQWLAAGPMPSAAGADFELVWRNGELSDADDPRPEGFSAESRATCTMTEMDAPHRLRFTWPGVGDVTFTLAPAGEQVLLTVVHRQLPDLPTTRGVSAGWHAHLDMLVAVASGTPRPSFWRHWQALRAEYTRRLGL